MGIVQPHNVEYPVIVGVVADRVRFHAGQRVDGNVVHVLGARGQQCPRGIDGYGVNAAVVSYLHAIRVTLDRLLDRVFPRLGVQDDQLKQHITSSFIVHSAVKNRTY